MSDLDDALSLLDYEAYEDDEVFNGEPQQQPQQQQPPQLESDDDDGGELDATLPAVAMTKAEKRKEKNRKKGLKRREKKNERLVANAIALAEGTKSRREIAEENMRRRIEGVMSRERGRLRQEAEEEIENRLAEWCADVEAGEISLERGVSVKEKEGRRRRQYEHLRRRRAEKQRKQRSADKGWAALGKLAVFGGEPDNGWDDMINAELAMPTIPIDDEPAPRPSH